MAAVAAERHCFAVPIAAEPDPAPAGSGRRALDAEPWADLTIRRPVARIAARCRS